jgi:serine/threonine-protein kinase
MTQPTQALLNNRYSLDKLLGKGGMAMVYLGRDLMLERHVAVKVLREDYSKDAAFRERFREEAKAVANLAHPNIVTVYDFGLDAGRLFIVMEYVPGKDLHSIIAQRGRLRIREGVQLAIQACMGVGFAHRAGFVHCDIKPHNFLVTPEWRLKVTDFGIARALVSIQPDEEADIVWGSPQYFSPEQAGGQPPSPASDVYSLGVVMYQTLTGQVPFIGKTSGELARLHRRAVPIPPRELNPSIPQELEEVILKVLSKEPSTRYRTADQLGRVLQTIERRMTSTTAAMPATQVSEREADPIAPVSRPTPIADTGPSRATRVARTGPQPAHLSPQPRTRGREEEVLKIDWIAVGLAFVALSAVTGLLPFWLWVFTVLFPPG